jgi:hypothetical protein
MLLKLVSIIVQHLEDDMAKLCCMPVQRGIKSANASTKSRSITALRMTCNSDYDSPLQTSDRIKQVF